MVKVDIKKGETKLHGSADLLEAEIVLLLATFLREIVVDDDKKKAEVAARMTMGAIGVCKDDNVFEKAERSIVLMPKIKREGGEED